MKTHTFISRFVERIALALTLVVAAAAFLLATTAAQAQVTPTVTGVVRDAANNATSTVPVGAMVHLRATVASTSATTSPQGTVDFIRYNGTICSGTGTTFESNTSLSGGIADSDPFPATAGGMSFRIHYDGQSGTYAQATSSCIALSVNQLTPTLSLALSSSTVLAGTSVHATATLANASSTADGTVTYRVYTNNSCTNLYQNAGAKTVTNTSVPASNSIQFNTPGTYYWQGVYSGDPTTAAATSTCSQAVLHVLATSTAATGTASISGKVYNDLNRDRTLDSGEPGLSGFTVWLFKHPTKHFKPEYAYRTTTSDSNGNYSFENLPAGSYRVELKEQKENGWRQITPDFKKVELSSGEEEEGLNFGNASTTNQGNGNGNGNGGNNGGNNGNDFWWFFRGFLFEGGGAGQGTSSDFIIINRNFFENLFSNFWR